MKKLLVIISLLLAWSCRQQGGPASASHDQASGHGHQHGTANAHMNERSFDELVAHFESPERAEWQKPDRVLDMLGDLQGKTVMDIGSGTGYFSFRLAEAGARVICADVDDRFLAYIAQQRSEKGLTEEQVETRKVVHDSSGLREGEADLVFTVNTYHHIGNRVAYFGEVKRGLKPDARVVIIDFRKEDLPVGPPVDMKCTAGEVMDELLQAGFDHVEVDQGLLPYQYIITASVAETRPVTPR